jgi:aryl-alcohol dehydrogenase-like predicted oxidoreductase
MQEALGYAWSLPGVSLAIVGCRTPDEVEENVRIARQFAAFAPQRMRELEKRTRAFADAGSYFKKS